MSVRVGARVAPHTGVRRLRRPVASGAAYNPLTDWTTAPLHGVWASDPLWVPPADGGAVSSWRNGGSVGTPHFTQATGSKQPTYRAATVAYNSKPTVQFDGTDDYLAVNPADVAQTYYLVVVGGPTTLVGTYQTAISCGGGPANGLYARSSGPTYRLSFGTAITGGVPTAAPHLFVATAAGASSSLTVDGTSVASGNANTAAMSIVCLGAASTDLSTFADYLNGHIAYAAVFTSDPTAQTEWATFKAWVTDTYGITVA